MVFKALLEHLLFDKVFRDLRELANIVSFLADDGRQPTILGAFHYRNKILWLPGVYVTFNASQTSRSSFWNRLP